MMDVDDDEDSNREEIIGEGITNNYMEQRDLSIPQLKVQVRVC